MTAPGDTASSESLLGAAERVLAAGAALGGALYVLVNSAYIEFFDDFGVRPEQVGFDRGAVLARSAWLALLGLALLGPAFVLATRRQVRSALRAHHEQVRHDPDAHERDHLHRRESAALVRSGTARMLAATAVTLGGLVGFVLLQNAAEAEADRVARGESSNGIGWIVPVLDVRATRAEAVWLSTDRQRPPALSARHLMYLGGNSDLTVLLACGDTTLVVRTEDVALTFPGQGSAPHGSDADERADLVAARAAAGGCRPS